FETCGRDKVVREGYAVQPVMLGAAVRTDSVRAEAALGAGAVAEAAACGVGRGGRGLKRPAGESACPTTQYHTGMRVVLISCFLLSAADWPEWRGPHRDGVLTEEPKSYPEKL